MSRSLNAVQLIGNLGSDPEIRTTSGGQKVATFSLATGRQWTNAAGEKQEKTEWHKCVVWNGKKSGLADVVERYVAKGDKLYVAGRIEYRQYEDKDKQTRYITEINVTEVLMLGGGGTGHKRDTLEPQIHGKGKGSDGWEEFPAASDLEEDEMPF